MCEKKEYAQILLDRTWQVVDSSPMSLNLRSQLFDAQKEREDQLPIWVRLLGILMEYLTWQAFKCTGNKIGTFILADMSFVESCHMLVAHILISIELRES